MEEYIKRIKVSVEFAMSGLSCMDCICMHEFPPTPCWPKFVYVCKALNPLLMSDLERRCPEEGRRPDCPLRIIDDAYELTY